MLSIAKNSIRKDHKKKDQRWKERLTNKKLHELSITFCDACRYCFDLMLCENIDFNFEKLSWRVQMLSKTWYHLHIYIDAHYKNMTFMPILYVCRYSFAISTYVCNVFSIDFVKKSPFECCFWCAQCIETQARSSDNVKFCVFISLNVQWWSFLDLFVFCNIFCSFKAALFELERAMFTGATLFRCLLSSILVLILTVNNRRNFMVNVTWR